MLSPGLSFLTSCLTPCFSHHITALVISIHRLLFPLYALQLTSPRVQSFVYIWVAHPYLWVSPLSEPGCTGQHFCLKWWNKFAVSTFSKYGVAIAMILRYGIFISHKVYTGITVDNIICHSPWCKYKAVWATLNPNFICYKSV